MEKLFECDNISTFQSPITTIYSQEPRYRVALLNAENARLFQYINLDVCST